MGRIMRAWHTIQALIYRIQTSTPETIFGGGFLAVALVIAAFPGQRAIASAADGKTGGLVIAGLLIALFAACGGGLLFLSLQGARISDNLMKALLFPVFALWCLMLISVMATASTRPETIGSVLIIFIIVSMLMLMGMSHTLSQHRPRPGA